MHTEWIAATIGLVEASSARITLSRLGSCSALGVPNSLMSAPPENALPAPVMTIALTAGVVVGLGQAVGDADAGREAEAVDRGVVQRDHGDIAEHFVFSRHAAFLWDGKRNRKERVRGAIGACRRHDRSHSKSTSVLFSWNSRRLSRRRATGTQSLPGQGDPAGPDPECQTSSHSLRVVASARRLSGVPSNTMLPWPMTSARSEICMAMVSFCSISSTEMPLSLSVRRYCAHQLDDLRRQAFGRLVDDDQVGVAHQRAAQRQHLLLAARQHAGLGVLALLQAREHAVHVVEGPAAALARALLAEQQVLVHRELGEDVAVLGHVADAQVRDLVGLACAGCPGPSSAACPRHAPGP